MYTFMISVDERANERAKTLPQFLRLGIQPDIILPIMPPSPESNTEQAMRGLRSAAFKQTAALMVEDDIDIHPFTFPEWLQIAQNQPYPVTFCVLRYESLHPNVSKVIQKGGTQPPRLYEVQNLNKWFGSQCLYIPSELTARLVAAGIPDRHVYSFDVLFRKRLLEWKIPLMHCASDPVRHRAAPCVVNKGRKPSKSVTFGAAIDWGVDNAIQG